MVRGRAVRLKRNIREFTEKYRSQHRLPGQGYLEANLRGKLSDYEQRSLQGRRAALQGDEWHPLQYQHSHRQKLSRNGNSVCQ